MTALPTDAEIRARAEKQGLLEPGADLPHRLRKHIAAELLAETQKPTAALPDVSLLSRTTYPVDAGVIRVDVLFIPNPKEPSNG